MKMVRGAAARPARGIARYAKISPLLSPARLPSTAILVEPLAPDRWPDRDVIMMLLVAVDRRDAVAEKPRDVGELEIGGSTGTAQAF